MPDYDFTSLSSFDFEILVRDLLQKELGITLESFKAGRDLGIDLRYSIDAHRTLIVQCKHYANSPYSKLLSDLRSKELPKVQRLSPSRYILATSVGLTPPNKDELAELFCPYCTSAGDIYGRNELNNMLGKFPEVERQHFKLWLTSLPVLERVLHSALFNQTEADLDNIQRKLRYYVQNKSFFEANRILEEEHYCIIAGIPGIGKTTLAEILLVNYIGRGYEAISITGDISEAFGVLKKTEKQVFYYDDFLGQTSLEEKLGKNEERNLLRFIDTVNKSSHSRFILTTREYILNQAKATYEKLAQSTFDVHRCVISLADYTRVDRAKILFNHLYFSDLPRAYREALVSNRGYERIIGHPNFNPRIVEWMTTHAAGLQIKEGDYVSHFLANLDDPSRLWEHAFENQLSVAAQHLLYVLASLPREVLLEDLETAFDSYYRYSAKHRNFQTAPRDFRRALKELESNFTQVERRGSDIAVKFHNPSVRDFLEFRLLTRPAEVKELYASAAFYEQFVALWNLGRVRSKKIGTSESTPLVPAHISQNEEEFFDGLIRTFESGSCTVEVVQYAADRDMVIHKSRNYPIEPRIRFALRVAETLYGDEAFEKAGRMLVYMFDKLFENLESNKGDKQALVQLLLHLRGDQMQRGIESGNIPTNLLSTAKEFLMRDFQSIDDFTRFVEFERAFRETVTEDEHQDVADEFHDFCRDEIDYALDGETDPDSIRWFADELDSVALAFNINVEDEVARLKEWANNVEQEVAVEGDDNPEYEYGGIGRADTGIDIDSMFQSLLE